MTSLFRRNKKRCPGPCGNGTLGLPAINVQNVHTNSALMNPTQANSREFLQQAIDTEIKSLEGSIKSSEVLKLRRNALQPISSLPPEIFAAIFSYLCLPGIPSLGGKPARNLARLRVSHVCHQWREIALNQPQLWSHINFNTVSLAGATEILVRAKSVPLYMETRVSGQYDDDRFGLFLKEVQARLPNIRHLSIQLVQNSSERFTGDLKMHLYHLLPLSNIFHFFARKIRIGEWQAGSYPFLF